MTDKQREKVIQWLREKQEILVDDRCRQLIKDLRGRSNLSDAQRYFLLGLGYEEETI